jgi:hypothetical protein
MKHWDRSLQHTCTTMATYATSRSTFATSTWNTCNTPLKHLKHTLESCTFSTMSPCYLDEWTLVVAEIDVGTVVGATHGARRCSSGAALLWFSNAYSLPRLAPVGAALLLLLQHRCSLDRSRPAPSICPQGMGHACSRWWVCGAVGEGHGAMLRQGTGHVGEGSAAGRTDERPRNAQPCHDSRTSRVGNFFLSERSTA